MAVRPVFMPVSEGRVLVRTAMVEFTWHAGLAASQKQKSIASLHAAAQNSLGVSPILEVFSKSLDPLGMALNAFNLCPSSSAGGAVGQRGMRVQAAKVFREGGPYCDLLNTIARNAKRDPRLRSSGDLVAFRFAGQDWPLEPQTAFYDWLYVQALHRRPELTAPVMAHRAFTDIEFNPQVSINCQAYSVALCVALAGRGIHDDALASRDAFLACVASKPVTTARQDDERQGFLF